MTNNVLTFKEYYGESFMERVQKMDPKEIVKRPEVKALWDKGLFWALSHRRSFKYPRGIPFPKDTFWDYGEVKNIVPVDEVETALLCWAAIGSSGLIRNDLPMEGSATHHSFEGRVLPSGCNLWYGHLIFNNDDGVFLYRPHVPTRAVEIEEQEDMEIIFRAFKEGITQINDQPIRIGPGSPVILGMFDQFLFKPGQVQFFPVMETTLALINYMMLEFNMSDPKLRNRHIDDQTGKLMCAQHWVDDGYLQGFPIPLNMLEVGTMTNAGAIGGIMNHNMQLVATAMGLGTYVYSSINRVVVMGGTPFIRGLGFRFASDKKGYMYPVGIDGLFGAHLPPNFTLEEAIDDYCNMKWGPQGRYMPQIKESDEVMYPAFDPKPRAVHRPFKDNERYIEMHNKPYRPGASGPYKEEAKQIAKEELHYIYDTYGRIPRNVDPYVIPYVCQAQHIDVELYDRYYKEGAVWQEQREHLKLWHGLDEE